MNLRRAWPTPYWRLLVDCLPFAQSYRPLGLLAYRIIYDTAGFHPLAFHLVSFAFLLLNCYLLFRVARELTGSDITALFAALLGAFHSRTDTLYTNIGNLYDILCGTLFLTSFLLAWRESRFPSWPTGLLLLTYALALDAKEMACTLPVLLMAADWIYGRRFRWNLLAVLAAETVLFIAPKLGSSLNDAYQPQYTWSRFRDTTEFYAGQLFYSLHPLPIVIFLALIIAMGIAAWWWDANALKLSWIWIVVTPLPVAFIEHRGLNVWYIPLFGWALYGAALLSRFARLRTAWAFAGVAALLACAHALDRQYTFNADSGRSAQIKTFRDQFLALCPYPAANERVLFLDDPFPADEWTPSSFLQLYFRRPGMEIQRSKMPEHKAIIAESKYDWIFDYKDGRLVLVQGKR